MKEIRLNDRFTLLVNKYYYEPKYKKFRWECKSGNWAAYHNIYKVEILDDDYKTTKELLREQIRNESEC